MTWGAVGIGAGTAVAGYFSADAQAQATRDANRANARLSREQLAEQGRQFDIGMDMRGLDIERGQAAELERRKREATLNAQNQARFSALRGENLAMLDPYRQAGSLATGQMSSLLGLGTPEQQAAARASFSESPGQAFLREQQDKSLLQNAAAIGGLGGGNVRTALQSQAFGRAQTDYQNYLSQLGALSGQGLTAAQGGIQSGYGPSYLQTGTDQGVAQGVASSPEFKRF